jgi:hypothetical protein
MITYSNGAETEEIWNSRDGGAPKAIESAVTGETLKYVGTGERVVDHVPKVGDRIFVDLTDVRKHALVRQIFEQRELTDGEQLRRKFPTREAALASLLEFFDEHQHKMSDLLVVTSGFIEELQASRKPAEERDDIRYFDRKMKPITRDEYNRLRMDERYRLLARNQLGPSTFVATIWLGFDPDEKSQPEIFESIAYYREGDSDMREIASRSYYTENEALEGHFELADRVKTTIELAKALGEAGMSEPTPVIALMLESLAKKAGLEPHPEVMNAMAEMLEELKPTVAAEKDRDRQASIAEFEQATGRKAYELSGKCPVCGDRVEIATIVGGVGLPRPKDFAICANCGSVNRYNDEMQLQVVRPDDEAEITVEIRNLSKRIQVRGRVRHKN